MAAEQQPKPTPRRPQAVQIHVTPEGLEIQQGAGEVKPVSSENDIPWWAQLHIRAYETRVNEVSAKKDTDETPKQG